MTKMRVYEYAKKNNVTSKVVIEKLKELNIEVSNHMTTIEPSAIKQLDETFGKGKSQSTKEPMTNKQSENKQTNRNKPQTGENKQKSKGGTQSNKNRSQNSNKKTTQAKIKPTAKKVPTPVIADEEVLDDVAIPNRVKVKTPPKNKEGKKYDQEFRSKENKAFNRNKNKAKSGQKKKSSPPVQTPPVRKEKELPKKISYTDTLTVAELAKKLHREPSEIIKKLFMLGVIATINQELDKDAIELITSEYGVEVEEKVSVDISDLESFITEDSPENLSERPPVVTIMGHVDHGKTTLLDSIRHTKVTQGEAGGITQHIGAYQVEINQKKITFLDTPGHAAFTTMRARGAQVTDITILVVAADDGVMPQTVEAINHAKAAGVPIIVAVNKIDKPDANPERVMQELSEYGLIAEDWGGDTIFVPISALTGKGIDQLLEMILLVSEMEELKANPNRNAYGTVIEAKLDKGRGSVATLLVQNGTLKIGDPIVVGNTYGRVRAMVNDRGRRVKEAGPSAAVEITGLNEVPQAGDRFVVLEDEKTARQVGEARSQKALQETRNETARVSLDKLFEQMKQGELKELNIIVKADVQGSAEALVASLQKIDVEGAKVNIIHTGVGAITESDIILATASNAIIVGFNVRPNPNAKRMAEEEKVDIRLHRIIYKVIDEIEQAMKGLLDPEYQEKVIGQAEVRTTFKVSKVGTIAGSYVTDGKVTRDSSVRLIRNGIVIFEGEIDSLKRFKDDVKEVSQGYECGITIKNFNDIKEGDIIEAYIMEKIKAK